MKKLFTSITFLLLSNLIFAQTYLTCLTYGSPSSVNQYNETGYNLNGIPVEYGGCQTTPAIIIAVIDTSCNAWSNCDHNFGQANQFVSSSTCTGPGSGTCRNRAENYFIFRLNDPTQLDSMTSMLDSIPQNYYVVAYTWFTYMYSTIPTFTSAFQSLGGTLINTLPDNVPYIFYMKVGQSSSIIELAGTAISDTLILNTVIDCDVLSIQDNNDKNAISIYLDPNGEILHVVNINSSAQWFISDLTGKLVNSGQVNDNVIHTGKLSKSIYVCTIISEGKTFRKLFVGK